MDMIEYTCRGPVKLRLEQVDGMWNLVLPAASATPRLFADMMATEACYDFGAYFDLYLYVPKPYLVKLVPHKEANYKIRCYKDIDFTVDQKKFNAHLSIDFVNGDEDDGIITKNKILSNEQDVILGTLHFFREISAEEVDFRPALWEVL